MVWRTQQAKDKAYHLIITLNLLWNKNWIRKTYIDESQIPAVQPEKKCSGIVKFEYIVLVLFAMDQPQTKMLQYEIYPVMQIPIPMFPVRYKKIVPLRI